MGEEKVKYYKNKYFIVFYDEDGEFIEYMFDNIYEILKFQKKPITKSNVYLLRTEIYRALKSKNHVVRFLNGKKMVLDIVDMNFDEEV